MLVLGLTGKTGAGKSTVASFLHEKGCFIIDGDKIARDILLPGGPALKELADFFGEDIISEDGTVNRSLVAKRAFSSQENTAALNRITHPHIKKQFEVELKKAETEGCKAAVIDAAALLESDCKELCQLIAVVTAPEDIRLERILRRDGISSENAIRRIKAQKSDEYYFSQAHIIIRNYKPYELKNELKKLEELLNEQG